MGGLSVLLLLGLMWPVLICYALLPWILGVLHVALKLAAGVLLVSNGLFLAALLLLRRWLNGRGYLEDTYILTLPDWRGTALRLGRGLLKVLVVWESAAVALCVLALLLL